MKKNHPILAHGMESPYYVLDESYVYGPFTNCWDAELWVTSHRLEGTPVYFRLGKLQRVGTPDRADSVGTVMPKK